MATEIIQGERNYLLINWSGGFVGNSPVFWRDGGSGYTQWIDEAQRWTKDEAEKCIRSIRGSHNMSMWKLEDIESIAKRTIDVQDLRKLESQIGCDNGEGV